MKCHPGGNKKNIQIFSLETPLLLGPVWCCLKTYCYNPINNLWFIRDFTCISIRRKHHLIIFRHGPDWVRGIHLCLLHHRAANTLHNLPYGDLSHLLWWLPLGLIVAWHLRATYVAPASRLPSFACSERMFDCWQRCLLLLYKLHCFTLCKNLHDATTTTTTFANVQAQAR